MLKPPWSSRPLKPELHVHEHGAIVSETLTLYIKAIDQASAALASVGSQVDHFAKTAGTKLSSLGATLGKTGAIMSATVTLPIAAAGLAMVNMASDMAETTTKIDQLFGDSADSIQDWSDDAATAFGQSKQQALDAAANFAIFGKAAGLTGDDLVEFSTGFTALASDLASFNNTSPEQAINAIGSALRGEAEPLRAYGVLLDDATMRQKALELGIIETTKEALTPQQKVLAAQALIYEQTSAAQGDFARTSEGLANQQRILKARFVDIGTELGEKLLPIALRVVEWVSDLIDRFDGLSPTMQNTILVVGGLLAAIGPVITVLGGLFSVIGPILTLIGGAGGFTALLGGLGTAITALLGPIGLVVLAVGGLALAWERDWGGMKTKTLEFAAPIKAKLTEFNDTIVAMGEYFSFTITRGDAYNDWLTHLPESIQPAVLKVGHMFEWLHEKTESWSSRSKTALEGMSDKWGEWAGKVGEWVRGAWTKISETDWIQLGKNIIQGIVDGIILAPFTIADAIEQAANEALARLKEKLGIASPSKVMAEEVGLPMAQGLSAGFQTGLQNSSITNQTFNFSVQLSGTGRGGNDVLSSVQMLTALYG